MRTSPNLSPTFTEIFYMASCSYWVQSRRPCLNGATYDWFSLVCLPEMRSSESNCLFSTVQESFIWKRFSVLSKFKYILAYKPRFHRNSLKQYLRRTDELNSEEITDNIKTVKHAQNESVHSEIQCFSKSGQIDSRSKLLALYKMLHISGRLKTSILLLKRSKFQNCKVIFSVRELFWIGPNKVGPTARSAHHSRWADLAAYGEAYIMRVQCSSKRGLNKGRNMKIQSLFSFCAQPKQFTFNRSLF